jgi:hypothetical protein
MKRLMIGAAVMLGALVVSAAAQEPKYGVTVTPEKGVDYSRFKTYSWTKGQPAHTQAIDAQIVEAVDRELAGIGMTKATSNPDVLITYYSVSRTDVDTKAKADTATGLRPQRWVGTLVVALLDPPTRKRLLRLRVDKPIDVEPSQLQTAINSAVTELFAKYPTRTQK